MRRARPTLWRRAEKRKRRLRRLGVELPLVRDAGPANGGSGRLNDILLPLRPGTIAEDLASESGTAHKSLEIANQNPGMLPRAFDLDELRRDVALDEALLPVTESIRQLAEMIEDTQTSVRSDA